MILNTRIWILIYAYMDSWKIVYRLGPLKSLDILCNSLNPSMNEITIRPNYYPFNSLYHKIDTTLGLMSLFIIIDFRLIFFNGILARKRLYARLDKNEARKRLGRAGPIKMTQTSARLENPNPSANNNGKAPFRVADSE